MPWLGVDFDAAQFDVSWQLQRINGTLIYKRRPKTDNDQSSSVLPLPDI
jgi:hypothetical protein